VDIKTYVSSHGGTGKIDCPVIAGLASRSDCSAGTVYQILLGLRKPSAKLANRIHLASDGEIALQTLREDVFGSLPAPGVGEVAAS
jgi:hypothetical protein